MDHRARRVKTDRDPHRDRLLRSLTAYLRGEPKVWSVVRRLVLPKRMRCPACTRERDAFVS